jgi:hypothetical protein
VKKIHIDNKKEFFRKSVLMLIGGVFLIGAPAYPIGGGGGMGGRCMMNQNFAQTNFAPLDPKQKEELLYIYQEEKVARDVYTAMHKLYPKEITFANILNSEQRHMDRAEMLCKRYGVDILKIDQGQYGKFAVPELQKLHDALLAKGEKSLKEALKAGELIEVTDIADIDKMLPSFKDYPDVTMVLERLKQGSNKHLNAFRYSMKFVS